MLCAEPPEISGGTTHKWSISKRVEPILFDERAAPASDRSEWPRFSLGGAPAKIKIQQPSSRTTCRGTTLRAGKLA
jgi:hypothetical protein